DLLQVEEGAWLPLRPMPVNSAPENVAAGLAKAFDAERVDGLTVRAGNAVYFVQPVDSGRSVIRGLVSDSQANVLARLREKNRALAKLRDRLERAAARKPAPAPLQPTYEKVSAELATM